MPEILESAKEVMNDLHFQLSNQSSSLDVSSELEKIRTELNVLRRLQHQDRHYQASINTMFEKLHEASQGIYKDFRDSIDTIKVNYKGKKLFRLIL